jgi:amino acid transporter
LPPYFAEETTDLAKNLPKSMMGGTLLIFYLFVVNACHFQHVL